MSLLVYAAKSEGVAQRLRQGIEEIVPKKNFELFQSFSGLSHRLKQPMNGLEIAVLLAGCDRDLTEFLSLQDLLSELRILLIVPDRGPDTFAKAHKLRPRFMTHIDSDFEDIKAVLGKMVDGLKPGGGRKLLRKSH